LRYQGLRFQITLVYWVEFIAIGRWEDAEFDAKPPIKVHTHLCDVLNCPGKTGDHVLEVLEKQWARYALNKYDCVAGTGDGGGENEGASGVHSQLERFVPDYCRRRCLGHLPWRVADQGLIELGDLHIKTKAISAFLHESGTWNRFKSIAVADIADGGLALFPDASPAFAHMFGCGSPRSLDERPDTTAALLEWLIPRHQTLAIIVRHDEATRELKGKTNILARESLQSNADCVARRVAFVLIKKALFTYYYIEGREHVALHTNMEALFERAKTIIMSTACDEHVLRFLGHSMEDVRAADLTAAHWVEIAVRLSPGVSEQEQETLISPMIHLSDKVALRMQAHLSLNALNILRSTWAAARILSSIPGEAQIAAKELLWAPSVGLMRLREDQLTNFEAAVISNEILNEQLQAFAGREHPVCVWRGEGRYTALFVFLANRFCGAKDHVLDVESVHAQWKHLTNGRNALKFKTLNAVLKLRHYFFTVGNLPAFEELDTYIEEVAQAHRQRYLAIVAAGDVAPRFVADQPFRERFHLRAVDAALVRHVDNDGDDGDADEAAQGADRAFANYTRFLFEPHQMYRFTGLPGDIKYVYITENKTVAYRDKPKPRQAIGRHLSMAWYQPAPGIDVGEELKATEEVLLPCAGYSHDLPVQEMTLAEMSLAAGYNPNVAPEFSERDVERTHETSLLAHGLEHFESRRLIAAGWARIVDVESGVDIEHRTFQMRPLEELTKMALARALQSRDGFSDAIRTRVWALPWNALRAAMEATPAGAVALAKAVAAPRGGAVAGKGRGAGGARGIGVGCGGVGARGAGGGIGYGADPVGGGRGRGGRRGRGRIG
jgi:hypothetical protein